MEATGPLGQSVSGFEDIRTNGITVVIGDIIHSLGHFIHTVNGSYLTGSRPLFCSPEDLENPRYCWQKRVKSGLNIQTRGPEASLGTVTVNHL